LAVITIVAVSVGGCATTLAELESQPPALTFESPHTGEETYRLVVQGARACFSRIFEVSGDYFPSKQEGMVTAALQGMGGKSSAFVIRTSSKTSGPSTVEVFPHPSAKKIPLSVRAWVQTGRYEACDL
jgi:hypothetical protein